MKTAFPPIENKESKILILGTMPGERSIQLQQYYGHRGNHFWKLMFEILDQPFSDNYEERVTLLLEKRIALWDVLSHCEREGSNDSNIMNEIPNDFSSFFRSHPGIKHVFFGSKKAEQLFNKHVQRLGDHKYSVLPSPSGANTWKTYEAKLSDWKIILEALR